MPQTPHTEKHFTAGELVRDIVIGMSDGLTVPFALAAGLSGAVASTAVVVTAGLAEVAAGSIAMGLGGYLAARSDAEHYANERRREEQEIVTMPKAEEAEVADVFRAYGLGDEQITPVVAALKARPEAWVDFMMRFELGLEKPQPTRARNSAPHHRPVLHCWRNGPAPAVYADLVGASGAARLRCRYPPRPLRLWLRQGDAHREDSLPQRRPDVHRRWAGGGGGVPHRQIHRLAARLHGHASAGVILLTLRWRALNKTAPTGPMRLGS